MPEMHLRQPGFTDSACRPFTKNKERIQKFKETGDSRYIYKMELDKACFQHDMTYGDFKDLTKRTAADKVLKNKAFNITKNPKYDGYQRGFIVVSLRLQINLLLNLQLKMKNWLKNFIKPLLENLTKGKYIQHLKTIFGLEIWQICN